MAEASIPIQPKELEAQMHISWNLETILIQKDISQNQPQILKISQRLPEWPSKKGKSRSVLNLYFSFEKRQQDHISQKQLYQNQMNDKKQEDEMKECTFRPQLRSKSGCKTKSRGRKTLASFHII